MSPEVVLSAHEVRKVLRHHRTDLEILKGVSLDIHRGEFIAITGPSGSGKSTLLYLLGALDRPTSGHIEILGRSTESMSDPKLAALRSEDVGFVFQFHFLLPELTALENVMAPLLLVGTDERAATQRATMLLEQVGLGHRLSHTPAQLSGGEQQRVAIARALANKPTLLLGDEPTGNLDTATGQTIYELFREHNKTQQQTIVIVTHNRDLAQHADRIIEIVDGRVRSDERR